MAKKTRKPKSIEALTHEEARRTNLPSAEHQSLMRDEEQKLFRLAYERRNLDLDPQLVWRGKDQQDQSDLVVNVPPLYIQERIHPKALIDDLMRSAQKLSTNHSPLATQLDLFADFNGLPSEDARTEFYRHDANWSNRMILGDSLQVMASLAEREGLRGKVQCIYIDPPYGIRFNSNFQWSTTSRDVRDGNAAHITHEPEQVKAFRDTWRDGIHSYLSYLRDRLTVARDLLSDSGSIFVQIGDENVHRVRALMDEVLGEQDFVTEIKFKTTSNRTSEFLPTIFDSVMFYAKNRDCLKFRRQFRSKDYEEVTEDSYGCVEETLNSWRRLTRSEKDNPRQSERVGPLFGLSDLTSSHEYTREPFKWFSRSFGTRRRYWSTSREGMTRLGRANRLCDVNGTLRYKRFFNDTYVFALDNIWHDLGSGSQTEERTYVVQTLSKVIQRCILMTTDPGDLVLDPTCGSGTTAYVAEQWGRRWITIDTSRVALALARARVMGARYPYYMLSDSPEGQHKEAEITGRDSSLATDHKPLTTTHGNLRQGFVYQRVPHITLRAIANNSEIDVIWEQYEKHLAPLRARLAQVVSGLEPVISDQGPVASDPQRTDELTTDHRPPTTGHSPLEEWEVPRQRPDHWSPATEPLITEYWTARVARQREIDGSIARNADYEYLYDKPYEDRGRVRVAGPFTVESVSPHRVLAVDENGDFVDGIAETKDGYGETIDFAQIILENLRTSGVQQAHKEDRITFTSLTPWPGRLVCAEGRYVVESDEGKVNSGEEEVVGNSSLTTGHSPLTTNHSPLSTENRAAIFIGPEFGTVSRPDLVEAAREAAEGGFDVLIACAFNYEAHTTEFESLGKVPVLKARMNADLHMAGDLKNTGKGNLFVIFGEPDVTVASEEWLVDSLNNRIAPYEIFKLVSGTESLAEINGLDREDLRAYAALSCRGEIWDYLADAAGGVLDSGEYRRGTSEAHDGGISSVARSCAGLFGGIGNFSDIIDKAGDDRPGELRALVEQLRRDKQNAQRANQITIHSPLTTIHYSQVTVNGVDVFHPSTGEVRSDGPEGIACWFIDTDYNEESFFVRHAYFLGAGDPYKSLKTTLKAEINQEAWASLNSDTSRPFEKPSTGRIAVKVINHLGDEVMKVFRV